MNPSILLPLCIFLSQIVAHDCTGCPVLDVANGEVHYDKPAGEDGTYPTATRATYTCNDEFVPKSNAYGFCYSWGSWHWTDFECIVACPGLSLSNGSVSYEVRFNYRYPDGNDFPRATKATFTCDEGYSLFGAPALYCRPSRIWRPVSWTSQLAPTCRVTCLPLSLSNGLTSYDRDPAYDGHYPVETTASFTCNDGYSLCGALSRRCQTSGNWSEETPTCRVSCPTLNLSNGLTIYDRDPADDDHYPVETTATFTCNDGYSLYGALSRRCQTSGSWSQQTPTCRVSCPALNVANGRVNYNRDSVEGGYPCRTEAQYSCNYGYSLSGPPKRYCQISEDWTGPTPACNPVPTCSALHLNNGEVSYNKEEINGRYPVHTYAQFKCNKGYFPVGGSGGSFCQSTEIWRQQLPTCKDPGCFPSMAKVKLENGMSITMSELRIGSRVQTVSSTGSVMYNEVTTFMQKDPEMIIQYKSVATLSNQTLILSGNHLIYAQKFKSEKYILVYADQLSVGDAVLVHKNDKLMPSKVIKVSNLIMQGLYVPLTNEGDIVVDGVLSSCYASFNHDLAHIGMRPIQWIPEIVQWIFGEEDGLETYVGATKQLGRLILPRGQI